MTLSASGRTGILTSDTFLDPGEFFWAGAGKEIATTVPEEETHGFPDAGSHLFLDVFVPFTGLKKSSDPTR